MHRSRSEGPGDVYKRRDISTDNPLVKSSLNHSFMSPAERLDEMRQTKASIEREDEIKKRNFEMQRQQKAFVHMSYDRIPPRESVINHILPTLVEIEDYERLKSHKRDTKRPSLMVRGSETLSERPLMQKKRVSAEEQFNYRFMDTRNRLWPKPKANWDLDRALQLRSYDIRDRNYNPINHCYNTIDNLKLRDVE